MLDLKSKLAAAGLVTQQEIDRVEREKAKPPAAKNAGLNVKALEGKSKGEIYEAIRRWVEKVRLDPPGAIPSVDAKPFHFPKSNGKIGRLMLEPGTLDAVQSGKATVVAYMSNHGLAHAIVPAAGAAAVGQLRPDWVRRD